MVGEIARPAFSFARSITLRALQNGPWLSPIQLGVRVQDSWLKVSVKSAAGLSAEPAGGNIFLKHRTRAIFRISKAFLQHVHDVHAHIEADKIGQLQWAHRMVHA